MDPEQEARCRRIAQNYRDRGDEIAAERDAIRRIHAVADEMRKRIAQLGAELSDLDTSIYVPGPFTKPRPGRVGFGLTILEAVGNSVLARDAARRQDEAARLRREIDRLQARIAQRETEIAAKERRIVDLERLREADVRTYAAESCPGGVLR